MENTVLLDLCNLRVRAQEVEKRWAELGRETIEDAAVPLIVGDRVLSAQVLDQRLDMLALRDAFTERDYVAARFLVARERLDRLQRHGGAENGSGEEGEGGEGEETHLETRRLGQVPGLITLRA